MKSVDENIFRVPAKKFEETH